VFNCRIAANFIPYGPANTDKTRNKILRVNDLLARQTHGGRAAFGASRPVLIQATANDKWSRGAQDMFNCAHSAFPDGQLGMRLWPGGHMFARRRERQCMLFSVVI
jgi:hypothetical protein